ncbi:MAG: polysaccharide deacetylase family protein [Blastocatellia bacterium]|nr:polysaccharide deacetylase family protein [Blastocatellia bacterium]
MKSKTFAMAAFAFLLAASFAANVQSQGRAPQKQARREVAVTFDDLPVVSTRRDLKSQREITARLLKSITSKRVPAIGFVNENKLLSDGKRDESRVALLRMWIDAGLELGNHTFSHIDLNTTPLAEFQDDVIRGEEATAQLLAEKGKKPRYFRHPYLHTGRDFETKQRFEEFLAGRGYTVAPVTIDNSEWIFARAYDRAIENGDRRSMKRIAEAYIPYLEKKFEYFEKQSAVLFGYEIKQVLLLHANALNADHFDDLARMMKRRGYAFITLEEALKDEAYRSADTYTGAGGITWLHRWAITKGMKGEFFRGEPATPDFILKLAGVTSE